MAVAARRSDLPDTADLRPLAPAPASPAWGLVGSCGCVGRSLRPPQPPAGLCLPLQSFAVPARCAPKRLAVGKPATRWRRGLCLCRSPGSGHTHGVIGYFEVSRPAVAAHWFAATVLTFCLSASPSPHSRRSQSGGLTGWNTLLALRLSLSALEPSARPASTTRQTAGCSLQAPLLRFGSPSASSKGCVPCLASASSGAGKPAPSFNLASASRASTPGSGAARSVGRPPRVGSCASLSAFTLRTPLPAGLPPGTLVGFSALQGLSRVAREPTSPPPPSPHGLRFGAARRSGLPHVR
jgi:hypothetical protein